MPFLCLNYLVDYELANRVENCEIGFITQFSYTRAEEDLNALREIWRMPQCGGDLKEYKFKWSCMVCELPPLYDLPGMLMSSYCTCNYIYCIPCIEKLAISPLGLKKTCPTGGCGQFWTRDDHVLIPYPEKLRELLKEEKCKERDERNAKRNEIRASKIIDQVSDDSDEEAQKEEKLRKKLAIEDANAPEERPILEYEDIERQHEITARRLKRKAEKIQLEIQAEIQLKLEIKRVVEHFTTVMVDETYQHPRVCSYCRKIFKYPEQVRNHIDTVHLGTGKHKKYGCPVPRCTYTTERKNVLKHHMAASRCPIIEETPNCRKCGGLYPNKRDKNRHEQICNGVLSKRRKKII